MAVQNIPIRVRYAETDRMGIAHHASHIVWFEVARSEFFRNLGLPFSELEKRGTSVVVVETLCRYKNPAHYDDLLVFNTSITKVRHCTLEFEYLVVRDSDKKTICEGKTKLCSIGRDGKPCSMDPELLALSTRALMSSQVKSS
jgi:acyl-CoA thioester hydrolase